MKRSQRVKVPDPNGPLESQEELAAQLETAREERDRLQKHIDTLKPGEISDEAIDAYRKMTALSQLIAQLRIKLSHQEGKHE